MIICLGNPIQIGCTYVEPHSISEPDVAQSLWYLAWCSRYGKYLWTLALFGSSLAIMWSISCTNLHSYQQGNIVPWPHPQKNPKWARPHIFQIALWNFSPSNFSTNVWHGGEPWGVWRWSFPFWKICEQGNKLADSTIFLGHPHLSILQIREYQN